MAGSLSNSTSGKSKYEIKETNKIKETVNLVSRVLANQGKNSNVVIEITKVKGQYVTKIYNKDTPDQSKKIESESKNTGNKSGKDSDKRGDKDKSHKNNDKFKGETNTLANRIDYALSRFWGLDAKTYRAWGYGEKDIKAVFGTKAWERIAKEEAKAAKSNEGKSNNGQEGKPPKPPKGGPKEAPKGANPNNQGAGKERLSRMERLHGKGNTPVNPHPKDNNLNPDESEAVKEFLLNHKEEVEEATGMMVEDALKLIGASDKNESPVVDVNDSKQWDEQGDKMNTESSKDEDKLKDTAATKFSFDAIEKFNGGKELKWAEQFKGKTEGFGIYTKAAQWGVFRGEKTNYTFKSGEDIVTIRGVTYSKYYEDYSSGCEIIENGRLLYEDTSHTDGPYHMVYEVKGEFKTLEEVEEYLNEKYKDKEITIE